MSDKLHVNLTGRDSQIRIGWQKLVPGSEVSCLCFLGVTHASASHFISNTQDERRVVHGLQRATDDRRIPDGVSQHLAHQLEENVDLDALVELASQTCMPPVPEGHPAISFDQGHSVRLAVARDAAFSMYYTEYVPHYTAVHQSSFIISTCGHVPSMGELLFLLCFAELIDACTNASLRKCSKGAQPCTAAPGRACHTHQ